MTVNTENVEHGTFYAVTVGNEQWVGFRWIYEHKITLRRNGEHFGDVRNLKAMLEFLTARHLDAA